MLVDRLRFRGILSLAYHEQRAKRRGEGMIFHVLNRGNARDRIFADDADDAAFEVYVPGQSYDLTTGANV